METFFKTIFFFIIYSFLGWLCEDIYVGIGKRKLVNRGFLYGPYCPIYGFGALLVLNFLWPVKNNPILVFLGGILLTSILEYITSWIMEKLFHERWWDYSNYPFNIHGRVCLKNSLLFGLLALFITYGIHPYIIRLYNWIQNSYLYLLYILFAVGFVIDIYYTVTNLLKRKKLISFIHKSLNELEQHEKELTIELIKNNPAIMEKINSIRNLDRTHLSKAFPNRIIKKGQIHDWLEQLKKKED